MSGTQAVVVSISLAALALLVLGAAVWDVYLAERYGSAFTISESMRSLGFKWPITAAAIGFFSSGVIFLLAGHFWGGKEEFTWTGPLMAFLYGAVGSGIICFIGSLLYWQQGPVLFKMIKRTIGL
jgi:hypothetical protein